ncbi:MAG TPA: response regulator [Pyrinomonadaceae bacterium]|nr:response regulator [Pyrinomonadaceae bacterium]
MTEADTKETRALLVADGEADALAARLASAGVEVVTTTLEAAPRAAADNPPSVALLAFGAREGEQRLVALARRLRHDPRTHAVPLVFLFRTDERTLRSAALHVGADDYFSREAEAEEFRARLSALFWRAEAGRRHAPAAGDRRSEIDDFIFLVETVGADAARGERGSVALVEADGLGPAARRALTTAQGFLKLNLRRRDSVAFYGPATLLVYLPGLEAPAARGVLSRLREEFKTAAHGGDLKAGLAAFPADGVEAEGLVEKAQAALVNASHTSSRVFAYGEEESVSKGRAAVPRPRPQERPEAAPAPEAAAEPVAPAEVEKPAPTAETGAAAVSSEQRGRARQRRLMLAVSNAARMAQVNLLVRSAGYEVRAAFDGEHALNLLRIDRPDLLLLDYELRGMDGVETLRRLAKQAGPAGPPSVLLLPEGLDERRRDALEAGARGVVRLPYDPVELLDALREAGDETE